MNITINVSSICHPHFLEIDSGMRAIAPWRHWFKHVVCWPCSSVKKNFETDDRRGIRVQHPCAGVHPTRIPQSATKIFVGQTIVCDLKCLTFFTPSAKGRRVASSVCDLTAYKAEAMGQSRRWLYGHVTRIFISSRRLRDALCKQVGKQQTDKQAG